jgi:hypothetical protein
MIDSVTSSSLSEDRFDTYKADPTPQTGDVIGRVLILACTFFAVSSFVPAALKKQRIYTPPAALHEPPQQVIIEEGVEVSKAAETPKCTNRETQDIRALFTLMAEGSLMNPFVLWQLNQLGDRIRQVHPLSLLLNIPRDKMKEILLGGNPIKINTFVDGIDKGCRQELQRNNLTRYLADFAKQIGKPEEAIKQLIQAGDSKAFVHFLFDIPA